MYLSICRKFVSLCSIHVIPYNPHSRIEANDKMKVKANDTTYSKNILGFTVLQTNGLASSQFMVFHPALLDIDTQFSFSLSIGGVAHPLKDNGAPSTHEYEPMRNLRKQINNRIFRKPSVNKTT